MLTPCSYGDALGSKNHIMSAAPQDQANDFTAPQQDKPEVKSTSSSPQSQAEADTPDSAETKVADVSTATTADSNAAADSAADSAAATSTEASDSYTVIFTKTTPVEHEVSATTATSGLKDDAASVRGAGVAHADATSATLEAADTAITASAAALTDNGKTPFFKIGEDVSAFTGRPRITPEENRSLKQGSIVAKKALHSVARAHGEEYEPFRLPAHMRAALAQIDQEAEAERQAAAKAAGHTVEPDNNPLAQLHSINPQEREELLKQNEKERINAGGARFYGKYQALLEKQQERKEEMRQTVKRNLKIAFIVIIGLMAYVGYNFWFGGPSNNSVEELKAALPLNIDSHTALVRIDDRNNDFKMYFEMTPDAFTGMDAAQKEAKLDAFARNAPLLCKNQLVYSIIASGKKVTVLLEASDRSFFREFSVTKCPSSSY